MGGGFRLRRGFLLAISLDNLVNLLLQIQQAVLQSLGLLRGELETLQLLCQVMGRIEDILVWGTAYSKKSVKECP